MELNQVLCPSCTRHDLAVSSRKRTLELASDVLAEQHPELDAEAVFDALLARERLGSTAVGEGVAIPHCRTGQCRAPVAALLHLNDAVDFDAPDGVPVDLVFVLVVPEEADEVHLDILASAAGALHDADYRQALRSADDDPSLFARAVRAVPSAGTRGAAAS